MTRSESLRRRALALLARREHSRAELARKLAPYAADPDELEAVLEELVARGWLSDARFAEALVHDKAPRFGAARLEHELRQRGVPEAVIRERLADLRETELERARRVWRSKFGALPADARERARQLRFLAQRGFSHEVIARLLRPPRAD